MQKVFIRREFSREYLSSLVGFTNWLVGDTLSGKNHLTDAIELIVGSFFAEKVALLMGVEVISPGPTLVMTCNDIATYCDMHHCTTSTQIL